MQGCQYVQDVDLFSDMLILQQKGNKVTLDVSVVQIQSESVLCLRDNMYYIYCTM